MMPALRLSVVVLAAGVGSAWASDAEKPDSARPASPQPATTDKLTINVRTGTPKQIVAAVAAAKGKVVLVDFWATWCEPCKEMFPHLVSLHRKHAADGLHVMAVSVDDTEELATVRKFLTDSRADFPVLVLDLGADNFDTTATALNKELFPAHSWSGSVPITLVFGRDGKLIKFFHEKADEKELDRVIAQALAAK